MGNRAYQCRELKSWDAIDTCVGVRGANEARDERGDTLLEVLMALLIIGIASIAIVGAYTMSIGGSGRQKTLSQLNVLLHNFAESVTYQIQLQPQPLSLYSQCATVGGSIVSSSSGSISGTVTYAGTPLNTTDLAMPALTSISLSAPASIEFWDYATSQWILGRSSCLSPPTSPNTPSSVAGMTSDLPQMITAVASGPNGMSDSISFVVIPPTYNGG